MRLHEVYHLLTHSYSFLVDFTTVDCVTLAVGMRYHGLDLFLAQGIDDIPKILLIALSTLVDLRWEVRFNIWPFGELLIK